MRKSAKAQKIFGGIHALVMGLGLHGGGVATVKWLVKHGASVTVTDLRDKILLAPSVLALRKTKATLILGRHRTQDFNTNKLIVVNPGIPRESKFLAIAKRAGKRIENDASLFFLHSTNPIIGVTGTRGKTTTTLWIAKLLKKKYPQVRPSGNTPDNALLKEFERVSGINVPVVAELSSWQLEYLPQSGKAPHVAVITNIYPDHLNRYRNIADYATAKAGIFLNQVEDDMLILNHDNAWHEFFAKRKPKSALYYISNKMLPNKLDGLYLHKEKLIFRRGGKKEQLFSIARFMKERGEHNIENLMNAVLAVKLFDPKVVITEPDLLKLPTPPMRQEVVYKKRGLTVVNDSCATSPDGTIAAIRRFSQFGVPSSKLVLIAGGTDKELEFGELAKVIKKHIKPENLILLEGSATKKLVERLKNKKYNLKSFPTLKQCVDEAFAIANETKGKTTILFSPGAASFEKFLHEFDRGKQFGDIVVRTLHQKKTTAVKR